MPYANNKGADQPAHLHNLISVFVVIIPIFVISKISRLLLASGAEQAGLNQLGHTSLMTGFLVMWLNDNSKVRKKVGTFRLGC